MIPTWQAGRHRTLYADDVSEWTPVSDGYQHIPCASAVDFHWFSRAPYLRPLLAICQGCGMVWHREKARKPWRIVA